MWFARQRDSKTAHVFTSEEAALEYAEDNLSDRLWTIWDREQQ